MTLDTLDTLDTPTVVIDLERAERNIAKAQAYCDQHGLALRPHIKTHKLPYFAHKQVAAGAVGITAQKVSEAEVMAAAGIEDILITYNLMGGTKIERLARLARLTKVSVGLDNEVALEAVAAAAKRAGEQLGVLVEFESGKRRTGVLEPTRALALAEQVDKLPQLEFMGLMTYPSNAASGEWLALAKPLFERAGIEIPVVSGGGTPGMWRAHEVPGVSELRVGTYIYHDRATVGAGAASLDECAMHIYATVVSRPAADRGVIDAGSKTLSSDRIAPEFGEGYGLLVDYPEAVITQLSEEHGVLDLTRCDDKPKIGEQVRIVPNHTCVVTNLHDQLVMQRGGQMEAVWPVWARGKSR